MQTRFPVAIIGRGIAGLTCAYRFSQAGYPVDIWGPCVTPESASRVATGVSSIKGNRLASQPLFRLKVTGHKKLFDLLVELSRSSGKNLLHHGVSEPFYDLASYQAISAKVFRRQFRSLFQVNRRFNAALNAHEFYYPSDYFFDVSEVLTVLESELKRRGANFINQKIHSLSTGNTRGSLLLSPASKSYSEVVLAAGVGSIPILRNSGFDTSALKRVAGETLVQPDREHAHRCAYTYLGSSAVAINGQVRIGGSSAVIEDNSGAAYSSLREKRTSLEEMRALLFPSSQESVSFEWGERLRTRSRLPLVGEAWFDKEGKSRLRLATAYYKNGLQFADIAACLHVSQVCGHASQQEKLFSCSEPLMIRA